MTVSFEHIVEAATAESTFSVILSSSNSVTHVDKVAPGEPASMITRVRAANGTLIEFKPGKTITLSVRDWLAFAGVDLDASNVALKPDHYDSNKYPKYRISGANVDLVVEYSNLDPVTQKAGWFNRQVHALVRPNARAAQWAGDGPQTTWNEYPSGPDGAQTYDKVEKYRQGVIFHCTSRLAQTLVFARRI